MAAAQPTRSARAATPAKPSVYTIMHWVKVVAFGLVIGFGGKFLDDTFASRAKIFAYNDATGHYNDEAWGACVDVYDLAIRRHGALAGSQRDLYEKACINAGDAAYESALSRGAGMEQAVVYYERVGASASLPGRSQEYFIDAYINTGRYAQARAKLDAARGTEVFDSGRMPRLDEKLQRLEAPPR